jgi:hypothetical protein
MEVEESTSTEYVPSAGFGEHAESAAIKARLNRKNPVEQVNGALSVGGEAAFSPRLNGQITLRNDESIRYQTFSEMR